MAQKESAHFSFVAACGFYRNRSAAIRKEKDAQARNQSRTSSDSERQRSWRAKKCLIATNTYGVCAIVLKRKSRNRSTTLVLMARAINARHTSRISPFALLKLRAC